VDLKEAAVEGLLLAGADLLRARGKSIDFSASGPPSSMAGAETMANLEGADLHRSELDGARTEGARTRGTKGTDPDRARAEDFRPRSKQ
jgi:uncharacterized protein YjbI with pentapeptide repeats